MTRNRIKESWDKVVIVVGGVGMVAQNLDDGLDAAFAGPKVPDSDLLDVPR
jgi:hypothetical protein